MICPIIKTTEMEKMNLQTVNKADGLFSLQRTNQITGPKDFIYIHINEFYSVSLFER